MSGGVGKSQLSCAQNLPVAPTPSIAPLLLARQNEASSLQIHTITFTCLNLVDDHADGMTGGNLAQSSEKRRAGMVVATLSLDRLYDESYDWLVKLTNDVIDLLERFIFD